jgi:ADP-heptose:LPS heptosyltransferase
MNDGMEKQALSPEPETGAGQARDVRAKLESASSLLIVRLRSLGDSILALPTLNALHAWRRDLAIDVLAEAPFAPVFWGQPAVRETLALKSRSSPLEGWSRLRACREIRKRRYPIVWNLHGGSTSLFLTATSGAALKVGQREYRHSRLYDALIPNYSDVWKRGDLHTVEAAMTLLRWLEIPVPENPDGRLILRDLCRERIARRLSAAGIHPYAFFVVHVTATLLTKKWPGSKFAELGDRLSESYGMPVIFTAGIREGQCLLDVGQHAQSSHYYWSDLCLEDLFALIENCRLFIGNDSGPTHAAAALGKPVVVIWGSSNFRVWRPWGTEYEAVRGDLPCMPCPGQACAAFDRPKCIEEISADEVLSACGRMLARS